MGLCLKAFSLILARFSGSQQDIKILVIERKPESTGQILSPFPQLVLGKSVSRRPRVKLELPEESETWFEKVIAHHDLRVYEVTTRIAFQANRLPWHHRDPADRFIIATALLHRLPIITADGNFPQYGVEVFC
jgi:predicted nucleic acid-binding protein